MTACNTTLQAEDPPLLAGLCAQARRNEEEAGKTQAWPDRLRGEDTTTMGLLSHRVERSEMKPGDHIYTWRAGYTYSHHGTTRLLLLLWSLSPVLFL